MDKEKYEILLSELAAVIKAKNDEIVFRDYQIEFLKEKLEAAEKRKKSAMIDGNPKIETK